MNKIILFLIIVEVFFKEKFFVASRTSKHAESIFLTNGIGNYCDEQLKCHGKNHTLCYFMFEREITCLNFVEYHVEKYVSDILLAHNGIRNKIAGKMKIPYMTRVYWDEELSYMALSWLRFQCLPWVKDPCANFLPTADSKAPEYHFITQNSYFARYKILPKNFIISAIREWYLEKNLKTEPLLTRVDLRKTEVIKRYFTVLNNFSSFANPQLSRVGCALVGVLNGYAFLCNYYKYIEINQVLYSEEKNMCPHKNPLSDPCFENLCVDIVFWKQPYNYGLYTVIAYFKLLKIQRRLQLNYYYNPYYLFFYEKNGKIYRRFLE